MGCRKRKCDPELLWLIVAVIGGVVVAFFSPFDHTKDPKPWGTVSSYTGWIYFFCWSVSFYPQVYLNWKRKSTIGLSFDFQMLNFVGFLCYAAFNCGLYFSPKIQQEYRITHNNTNSAVRVNDVFFSVHAFVLTCITLGQICWYRNNNSIVAVHQSSSISSSFYHNPGLYGMLSTPTRSTQEPTPHQPSPKYVTALRYAVYVVLALFVLSVAVVVTLTWLKIDPGSLTWLNVLYYLSTAKLAITIVKYIPQVYENYRRKSTVGWNIWNVLLDFAGGSLSICQLMIDCGSTGNWSGITGDPVKFLLGFVSIVFDIIFMVQHYIIYRNDGVDGSVISDPLLRRGGVHSGYGGYGGYGNGNQSFGSYAEDDEWMKTMNSNRPSSASQNLYDSWVDN
jgi:cystinosin